MGAPGGPTHLVRGDVVIVQFPFTDLSATKLRPALVVAALNGDDVMLCQITSQHKSAHSAIPITATDFTAGTLARDSYVRPEHLFTGNRNFTRRIGHLSDSKVQEVISRIIQILTT